MRCLLDELAFTAAATFLQAEIESLPTPEEVLATLVTEARQWPE